MVFLHLVVSITASICVEVRPLIKYSSTKSFLMCKSYAYPGWQNPPFPPFTSYHQIIDYWFPGYKCLLSCSDLLIYGSLSAIYIYVCHGHMLKHMHMYVVFSLYMNRATKNS